MGDDHDHDHDHDRYVREVMFEFDSGRPSFSYQAFVCFKPIVQPLNVTSYIAIIIIVIIIIIHHDHHHNRGL